MQRGDQGWHIAYGMFGLLVPGLAAILLPLLVVHAGHRPFRIGAVIAAQNWGVLAAPAWGWLADRTRFYRRTLFGGLLLSCLGLAVFALATRLSWLLLAAGAIGLGTGACNTAAPLLVTRFRPEQVWSGGLARLQVYGALGTTLGLVLASRVHPGTAIACACALVLPALIFAARGRMRRDLVPAEHPGPQAAEIRRCIGTLRWFLLFLLAWSLFSIAVSAFSSLYPVAMLHGFGIGVTGSSEAMAFGTLGSLPLYVVSGRLVHRHGCTRVLAAGLLVRMLALGGIAMLTVLHLTTTAPVLMLAALFQGAWPLLSVSANEMAAALAPGQIGLAVGIFNAVGAASSGLGAMLSGLVVELSGYRSISQYAAMIALMAFACSLPLVRQHQRRELLLDRTTSRQLR